ncbi:hypothetical protein MKW92_050103 [Papaver armeniacum]|nr:hypothetical protein MKW92_050103 [Papaver armeniacum]
MGSLGCFSSNHCIIFILMFISAYHDRIITAQAQKPNPFYLARKFCLGTNYTANSTYQTDLNLLLSSLSTTFTNNNTFPQYGYRNITIGANPNTVYGSLHCREDIPPAICSECAQLATETVMLLCPNKKTAIMFYDGCVLRYSDENYFSRLNQEPSRVLLGPAQNKVNQSQFVDLVTGLLEDLVVEAKNNSSISPSLYATRSANYTRFDDVYAMVQCTPDLTPNLCRICLRSAIGRLSTCCSHVRGARVLFPSCTFRFESGPFYGNYMHATPTIQALPPTLQPPSNTTNSNRTDSSKLVISIAIPLVIAPLLSSIAVWWFCFHKRKKMNNKYFAPERDQDIQSAESLQFNFNMISDATNNFAEANKLGEGGFGLVYKGILSDGQEIAVKRLSKSSGQGDEEFKNEVLLLAKLQHRNLVRLLGFCLHEQEELLVYKLMKASLDHFIFDTVNRTYILDWEIRYKIVGGIARGLLYLHEDSRVRIIHRDLKASNILLAEDMTPKISDFGLARLFVVDQTQADTVRIVGTYGYMAPEYAIHGRFSVKSDVFSFGVLVLEILSGKKNTSFYESVTGGAQDLLTYAWRHWQDGSAMELLDPSLNENCSRSEFMRCVHIALLCVQESIADRPTMASVILMLNSNSMTLQLPTRPAYFVSDQAVEEVWSVNEASVSILDPR